MEGMGKEKWECGNGRVGMTKKWKGTEERKGRNEMQRER